MFKFFQKRKKEIDKTANEKIVYRDMKLLSESAIGFVEMNTEDDIYRYIGKMLRKMLGDCIICIDEYVPEKKVMRFVDIFGYDKKKESLIKLLHFDPYKTEFPMSEQELVNLSKKSINLVDEGLYELFTRKLPQYFTKGVQKMLSITDVYIMGFSWEGQLYGNAVVMMRHGQKIRPEAIEAFLHQAAITLRRRESDIALQKSYDELEIKVEERTRDLAKTASDLEKFKLAVENTSDQVVITNLNGEIIYANNAATRITGYKESEIIGKEPSLWGDNLEDKYYQKIFDRVKKSKKTYRGELNNLKKSGEEYIADLRVDPVIDPRGEVIFYVGIERDITHEKKVDQAKTEFVSLASHQLRTPLSAINWYVELVMDNKDKLSKKQIEYLNEVYSASKRMGELVGSLLNVSRIELGTFTITPTKIDLKKVSESIFKELLPQIKKQKHRITKTYPKTCCYRGDEKLTRMIIHNLLSNAVKYTKPSGKITLDISRDKKWLTIIVKDNGMGIPKKQQEKMFTKLFRADNVRGKISEGTGLGMYIVKSIVDQVEGKISFKSKENKGTKFIIKLPSSGMKKKEGSKELS